MPNELNSSLASGTWTADASAVAACLEQPVVVPIDELGVIAVEGADAAAFLQSQLTNDVANLDTRSVQLNGYCSAKGRLYAVFNNWRDGDAVYLQLPREIRAGVQKRLAMFVLRAKARLRDASDDWTTFALIGPGAFDALAHFAAPPTLAMATTLCDDGTRIVRLPPAPRLQERFLLLVPAAATAQWRDRLGALKSAPSAAFWWSQIDAAIPGVFAATQEKFVPQMINLEVLGGVNFKKGCYPGQEVVARSQYLGKLRRRMHVAHADAATHAGADVFGSGAPEPIGTVVMAATAPQGGMDLLFECAAGRAAETLHLGASMGLLTVRPLPYALLDVTA